jgi:hypothetical protein
LAAKLNILKPLAVRDAAVKGILPVVKNLILQLILYMEK